MRCREHGKVIYTAETTAQLACVKAALEGDSGMTWYYSRECGVWHLTNVEKRGHTGKRNNWVKGFKNAGGCTAA